MKITPLDIQHKVFNTTLRGYDRRQVDQFLEDLAETVEFLTRDNAGLKEKLSAAEDELGELKKSETTLTNTLMSTQNFVEHLKRGAQRDADMIVKEAELKAEEVLSQSRTEVVELRRVISELRRHRVLVLERIRSTLNAFNRLIEVEEKTESLEDAPQEKELISEQTSLSEGEAERYAEDGG
jgi:cell division initiation protein